MTVFGIGPAGAARLRVEVGDVARFPSRHHFASWNGTAPLDASSGTQVRHRLSRAGNRRINHALHIAAVVQLRHDTLGWAYHRRKLADARPPWKPCATYADDCPMWFPNKAGAKIFSLYPIGAVMLVRVWEYEVLPGREAEFEQLYGSTGAWAQLFARSADHVSTELYRGVDQPARYLTVDRFLDTDSWQRFLSEHGSDYAELDARCAPLTTSEVEIR